MAGVNASQIEAEFKEVFEDIGRQAQYKRGRKLEGAIIASLKELQENIGEIVLFDIEETCVYRFPTKRHEYQIMLDKGGIRRCKENSTGTPQTISQYIRKRCRRYDQSKLTNPIYDQVKIAERIAEIYRGIKRPMKVKLYRD